MSRFSGRQHRGAMRQVRELKQDEAEARNAVTPDKKRRANRYIVDDDQLVVNYSGKSLLER